MGAGISHVEECYGGVSPATLSFDDPKHEPEGKSCRLVKAVLVDERNPQHNEEDLDQTRGSQRQHAKDGPPRARTASWDVSGCAGGTICTGLDELVFDYEDASVPVTLHVYDVGTSLQIRAVNRFLRKFGTGIFHCGVEFSGANGATPTEEMTAASSAACRANARVLDTLRLLTWEGQVFPGIFHCGVEVFGGEWSYTDRGDDCGVFCCMPGQCKGFRHVEAIDLGRTSLSLAEFRIIIAQLQAEWFSDQYHLLAQNCCHFCDEMCQRLRVASPPRWVNNFAGSFATLIEETPEHEERCTWQACPSLFSCCTRSRHLDKNTCVMSNDHTDQFEETELVIEQTSGKPTIGL
eukprot:CAMPEP_0172928334 /NCGR_PEP_ID=MMETSP1075-20121228/217925_1 /TAXON_ID=2916 /ORGANISM="Ceratium fusus, Strain PA161109" /LENGTH=349 /DNA_ID=CAMNT_0013789617 /DNA_START=102 /DNA_END=1152 /DNA_ORIENTATION=+